MSWPFYHANGTVDVQRSGHPQIVGTDSDQARCDHRHVIFHNDEPSVGDNWAGQTIPDGTLWVQFTIDFDGTIFVPDGIVGIWLKVAENDADEALWLELPSGGTFTGDAGDVPVTPTGSLAATDVQAALVELLGDIETHVADAAGAHAASAISVLDTGGNFTGTEVEAVLVEIAGSLASLLATLNDHSARHENGGADEISVAGLSGLLADGQTPLAHASSHQNGGGDEISVAGLSGELADPQPPKTHASSHEPGGSDAMDVDAAAAVGSLRTLGAGATQAAVGNHTHAGGAEGYHSPLTNGDPDDTELIFASGDVVMVFIPA